MKYLLSLGLMLFVIGFSNCNKETTDQKLVDEEIILKYISDNNLDAEKGEEGLYYVIDAPGTGDACVSTSTVKTNYKGYFTNGDVFDEGTVDQFYLMNAIRGWQLGIPEYKEGGSGILLIPSAIGYGPSGSSSGSIPPNAVIIFDIELIKVY